MKSLVKSNSILLASVALFVGLLNFLPFEENVVTGLSILVFIAILWLSEAVHISITALLVPLLAIGLGVFSTSAALSHFSNPIIFLFLGGFALAAALHRQKIDVAIANWVLNIANGRLSMAILLLFVVSAVLSMWISNTATAAMMLPLVLGMLSQIDRQRHSSTWTFALLGIAYCSSIGGIATLVGSPPNAIAAAETGMTFIQWFYKALPITLLLLPAAIIVLYIVTKPDLSAKVHIEKTPIEWDRPRKITLAIFSITVLCWVFSAPLNKALGGFNDFDSLIAIAAMLTLTVFKVIEWQDIEQTTDWSVLILFGGGLCLSAILKETDSSLFLADNISVLTSSIGPTLGILFVVAFVVFLTGFTSNTASAALLIPIFASLAGNFDLDPITISVVIAISASCAFMLPVSTPPNAIVFGTGFVPQRSMIKAGLWLNFVCIGLLTLYTKLFW